MGERLPVVSGAEAIRAFERLGYVALRQKGSHVRMLDDGNSRHRPLSIPLHDKLGPGLLRSLIREAGITVDEFRNLL